MVLNMEIWQTGIAKTSNNLFYVRGLVRYFPNSGYIQYYSENKIYKTNNQSLQNNWYIFYPSLQPVSLNICRCKDIYAKFNGLNVISFEFLFDPKSNEKYKTK